MTVILFRDLFLLGNTLSSSHSRRDSWDSLFFRPTQEETMQEENNVHREEKTWWQTTRRGMEEGDIHWDFSLEQSENRRTRHMSPSLCVCKTGISLWFWTLLFSLSLSLLHFHRSFQSLSHHHYPSCLLARLEIVETLLFIALFQLHPHNSLSFFLLLLKGQHLINLIYLMIENELNRQTK